MNDQPISRREALAGQINSQLDLIGAAVLEKIAEKRKQLDELERTTLASIKEARTRIDNVLETTVIVSNALQSIEIMLENLSAANARPIPKELSHAAESE